MIEDSVLTELLKGSPRLKAMLLWRLELDTDMTQATVVQTFLEDWNHISDLIKRVEEGLK